MCVCLNNFRDTIQVVQPTHLKYDCSDARLFSPSNIVVKKMDSAFIKLVFQ